MFEVTVGDCDIFTYRNIEWVELTTWVRIKNSVCKCTGMIVGMVQLGLV